MENQFGIVAIIAVVIIVALGLAFASNRAEQVKESSSSRKKAQKTPKEQKQKASKKNKSSKGSKNVQNVVFGSKDGKNQPENEDESMLELIQGTSKYYAKEAKEAAAALKKQIQSDVVQGKKQVQKKVQQLVDDHEDNAAYVAVNRSRKVKNAGEQSDSNGNVDQAGKKNNKGDSNNNEADGTERKRKQKPFLKSEIPPPREARKPGDKPRTRRERPASEGEHDQSGSNDDNERPRRRERLPTDSNDEAVNADGEEDRRPRQPRGPPKEPRERKPREVQPLPAPLQVTADDSLSLDAMLGAITSHYGTTVQKNLFTALAEKEKDRTRTKRREITSATGRSILIGILSYLPLRDIANLARVNNFFSKLTRDDQLWKNLCQRDFGMKFGKGSERKKFKPVYRDEFDKAHGRKPAGQNNNKNQKQDTVAVAAAPIVEQVAEKKVDAKKSQKKPRAD